MENKRLGHDLKVNMTRETREKYEEKKFQFFIVTF